MGFNTVVMLLNDQADRWPDDIREAMQNWSPASDHFNRSGYFGYGTVLSTCHADTRQIVGVSCNTGSVLSPVLPASPAQLEALADILKGHGYTVRRPGRSRGEGPYRWGYAALARTEDGGRNDG